MLGEVNILSLVIPSAIALIGIAIGHFLLRRSTRESNNTDAFTVVTDKLMVLVNNAEARIIKLEERVKELENALTAQESENKALHLENTGLHREIAEVKAELGEVKRLNNSLSSYVEKLIRHWPQGITMPEPDEDFDWESATLSSHS